VKNLKDLNWFYQGLLNVISHLKQTKITYRIRTNVRKLLYMTIFMLRVGLNWGFSAIDKIFGVLRETHFDLDNMLNLDLLTILH
jgi:hypothetical protein